VTKFFSVPMKLNMHVVGRTLHLKLEAHALSQFYLSSFDF